MLVKIQGRKVEVRDAKCASRPCFWLGFDKGTFSPGRGYTSYHTDARGRRVEKPVCMRRLNHGCPTVSICGTWRLSNVDEPGSKCRCGGTTIAPSTPSGG